MARKAKIRKFNRTGRPLLVTRSQFERRVGEKLDKAKAVFRYEPFTMPYLVPEKRATYKPDWVIDLSGKQYYAKKKKDITLKDVLEDPLRYLIIETKGRLTFVDQFKMRLIRELYPTLQILMWFQQNRWLTPAKRKRNTEWAAENGFYSCFGEELPDLTPFYDNFKKDLEARYAELADDTRKD